MIRMLIVVSMFFLMLSSGAAVTCKYCGQQHSSMTALVAAVCPRHPNGVNKGKHSAYEGADKNEYVCKYCGQKRHSIQALVTSSCPRHPNGVNKGKHSPAR